MENKDNEPPLVEEGKQIIIIAAFDSASKGGADYICTGRDDQLVIMQAAAVLKKSCPRGESGTVRLRAGNYIINNLLELDLDRLCVEGEVGAVLMISSNPLVEGSAVVRLRGNGFIFRNLIFIDNTQEGQNHILLEIGGHNAALNECSFKTAKNQSIWLSPCSCRCNITDNIFEQDRGYLAMEVDGFDNKINKNRFVCGNTLYGIWLNNGASCNSVISNKFIYGSSAIKNNGDNTITRDNVFESHGKTPAYSQ